MVSASLRHILSALNRLEHWPERLLLIEACRGRHSIDGLLNSSVVLDLVKSLRREVVVHPLGLVDVLVDA